MIMLYVKLLILAGAVLAGLGSVYVFKMKPDNPIEETAEEVIKKESGIDVDLTPDSPEKTEEKSSKE